MRKLVGSFPWGSFKGADIIVVKSEDQSDLEGALGEFKQYAE